MAKNRLVSVNNWAILGGVESLIMDMATVFPQYEHVLVTLNTHNETQSFYQHVQDRGIRYMNAEDKLTEALLDELDPAAVFLHNTRGAGIEGEWPFEWLGKHRVVGVHHAPTWPLFNADADWFVSDYVRRPYSGCEVRMRDAFTMPPCVYEEPYVSIGRPERKPVVGRIQSGTKLGSGKVPETFFDLLEQVQNCDFFVVTSESICRSHEGRERFRFGPIKPGAMPQYLKEVDVFAIWGDTPETWSRVVTEANLSGIPVVARNHNDGLAEQLRMSGGGVLVKSEKGFIENVQALVDDVKTRREMGERGRQWCLDHASSRSLKERFLERFLQWSLN